jgi:acyl-CoA dehydrogenase
MDALTLDAVVFPAHLETLRQDVRAFLREEIASGAITPKIDQWLSGWDPAFSRRLAARGWVGMALPEQYGGSSAGPLARFVVIEELLAAGAPVAAHWIADRQSGPSILKFGSEEQKTTYLPRIAKGECYFGIGMSEPDTGSDLASVRTRGTKVDGGWVLNGTKVWTSGAHQADALIALVRTEPLSDSRHAGLTQMIVDLPNPGIQIRPIYLMTGEHDFNEVVFENAFIPDSRVLGAPGSGWAQVTSELAMERSGPERILSTFPLLVFALRALEAAGQGVDEVRFGSMLARLWSLRQLSVAVAGQLDAGEDPAIAAALVKNLGTQFESLLIDSVRVLVDVEPDLGSEDELARTLAYAVLHSPGFTLRGGTNQILQGIVAKALGGRA